MMPQLDSASYLSQAFWLVVCFCTLWTLVSLFITPKLTDIKEQRKRKINDYVQKADDLNTKAKKTLENYEALMANAHRQADLDLAQGKQAIKDQLEDNRQKMNKDLGDEIAEYQKNLAKEQKQTEKQLEAIAQETALAIVQRLGFVHIDAADITNAAHKEKIGG